MDWFRKDMLQINGILKFQSSIVSDSAVRAMNDILNPTRELARIGSVFSGMAEINRTAGLVAERFAESLPRWEVPPSVFPDFTHSLMGMDQAFDHVQKSIADAMKLAISPQVNLGSIFHRLPDLGPLMLQLDRLQQEEAAVGGQALVDSGYAHLLDAVVLSTFAHLADVDHRTRNATVTNQLQTETRRMPFEIELGENVTSSTAIARRWPLMEAALNAHRTRSYVLSIPVLLAQFEGLIADALIAKGTVIVVGSKLYLSDGQGAKKLVPNKRDPAKLETVEVRGLSDLVVKSGWHKHRVLADIATFTSEKIAPHRNGIMHGRNTSYGHTRGASTSATILYALRMFATEIAAFESGDLPSDS